MRFQEVAEDFSVTFRTDSGLPAALETLNVIENRVYNAPEGKAYNKVIANVPNSYGGPDEGKVVHNGALVAQTERPAVTQNSTYDTTLNNSVTVNVSSLLLATNVEFDAPANSMTVVLPVSVRSLVCIIEPTAELAAALMEDRSSQYFYISGMARYPNPALYTGEPDGNAMRIRNGTIGAALIGSVTLDERTLTVTRQGSNLFYPGVYAVKVYELTEAE